MNQNNPNLVVGLHRLLLLAAVLFFHAGLVLRFRFVKLFPSDWIGYLTLGVLFLFTAIGVLLIPRVEEKGILISLPRFISSKRFQSTFIFIILAVILAGFFWRYQVYADTPVHVKSGDMLPVIELACRGFLSGEFPYQIYEVPHKQPLLFMPGLWMPYLPSQIVGFDLRHTGLLLSALTIILLLILGIKKKNEAEILLAAGIVVVLFCFSPAIARFSINGHTYPLWFYISGFCFCIIQKHYKSSAIFFGLMLASRQTSVIYLPLVLLFFWNVGWRTLISWTILSFVTCGIICLPFAFVDCQAFLVRPMLHYQKVADWDFTRAQQSYVSKTIGFAFGLKYLGFLKDLSWLRYVFLCLIPILAWMNVKDKFSLLISMGAVGIVFALITPMPWYYTFVPPILILSFASMVEIETNPNDSCSFKRI